MTGRALAVLAALGMASASCSQDCLALPCALPVAIVINLTGGTSGVSLEGATVQVTGAVVTSIPCRGVCRVPGTAGTYTLDVTAAGFTPVRRVVTVQGTNPSCGCPTVDTQNVAIALVPEASSSTLMSTRYRTSPSAR